MVHTIGESLVVVAWVGTSLWVWVGRGGADGTCGGLEVGGSRVGWLCEHRCVWFAWIGLVTGEGQ